MEFLHVFLGFIVGGLVFDLLFGHPKDAVNGRMGGIVGWFLS